jgi:hypothetical protein
MKDLLDRLDQASKADYLIYSNVDIAVMPEFYAEVKKIIKQGYDGFVINRRTISRRHTGIKDIPLMIAEARNGERHPGFDCFIFKRSAFGHFKLGTACLGGNWIGRILVSNIMAFSRKFKIFDHECLTFHLGDDRVWLKSAHDEFNLHNEGQLIQILNRLTVHPEARRKDTLNDFSSFHLLHQEVRPSIPVDLTEQNAPFLALPAEADKIYPTAYRGSHSWEAFDDQLLRQDPIFIVGYPRSGTTLVQALIATQENVVSFEETHFFGRARNSLKLKDDKILPDCIDDVVDRIRERVSFSKNAEAHIRALAGTTGLSPKMLFETMVIDNIISKVENKDLKAVRWMEKTPEHVQQLDVIFRFYPRAQVIYVMRDPEKSILSRRKHFTFNQEASWPIEKHVGKWLHGVREAEKYQTLDPQSVLIVKLEDVTRNPVEEMEKICEFLGIPFDEERLAERKEISKTLYYPWETWKDMASRDISPALALRESEHLSSSDRQKLNILAGEELKRYGYLPARMPAGEGTWPLSVRASPAVRRFSWLRDKFSASIVPLFKTYPGKINMESQLGLFFGQHRSGWRYAVQCLRSLHNPRGILFDAFIERTFAWRQNEIKPHLKPWVGFIHVPPRIPEWFQGYQSNTNIFKTQSWQESFPHCRGLFTLSAYHRRYLEPLLGVPINHLLFPTEPSQHMWSWERFEANKEKQIVQVGWWLRKVHAIFQLPTSKMKKTFLKINYFDWDNLIRTEREILIKEGTFKDEMYSTAEIVDYLSDEEYDMCLAENLVFISLYDSSANNTVIECIVRNTPLLVNPLESVREYLGEDYPFYFNSLEEAARKAEDDDLIYKTHLYLRNHPFKERFAGEYFLNSFQESEIYRSL